MDTARSSSRDGSYRGVLAGGLACSALPVPVAELSAHLEQLSTAPGRTSPLLGTRDQFNVDIRATVDGQLAGATTIIRRYAAVGVSASEVDNGRVKGLFYQPASVTGIPVVVVAGSGGGAWRDAAALLASRGHPALAVAYFNYPGLSASLESVPIETFAEANRWLSERTGAARVAMLGVSRGTEAVQLTAAHFPEHVAAIVLFVPAPLVHGGFGPGGGTGRAAWSLRGEPVPFVHLSERVTGEALAEAGRTPPGHSDAPAFLAEWRRPVSYERWGIPYDRIAVPILALGGGRDAQWPSGYGVEMIQERMAALGKAELVEAHVYPDAGHGISRPGIASPLSLYAIHRVSRLWSTNGGVPEANCAAGYDAWTRTLRFLRTLVIE